MLLLLVLAGLVLPAMDGPHPGGEVTGMVLFTLLFLAGLGTAWTESRVVFRAVAVVVAAAIAARGTRLFGDPVAEWRAGVDCIAFLTLALLVLAKSMRPGSVTRDPASPRALTGSVKRVEHRIGPRILMLGADLPSILARGRAVIHALLPGLDAGGACLLRGGAAGEEEDGCEQQGE